MKLYAKGTFTGNYGPRGDMRNGDCIIGCEFGAQAGMFWGLANEASAEYIAQSGLMRRLPLLLCSNIARPLEAKFGGPKSAKVFEGESSTATAVNQGTRGELLQALEYMNTHNLHAPILIGQARHVGRICLQAENLGMEAIVPLDLPERFDPCSSQIWAQGPIPWAIREAIGVPVLRLTGKF